MTNHVYRSSLFAQLLFSLSLALAPSRLLSETKLPPAPPKQFNYEAIITNNSSATISPGLYVVHQSGYPIFELKTPASKAAKALCETGRTSDARYYLEGKPGIGGVFTFYGEVKPGEKKAAVFASKSLFPYLTVLHKVSFSDDTCLAEQNVPLFNEELVPKSSSAFQLIEIDVGTRVNTRLAPPEYPWLESLLPWNWSYTEESPAKPIELGALLGEQSGVTVEVVLLDNQS